MKKTEIVLASTIAMLTVFCAVAPVLAKGYELTVTVKGPLGKPVPNVAIYLSQSGGGSSRVYTTDARGKVKISMRETTSGNWSTSLPVTVFVYDVVHLHYHAYPDYYLDSRYSGSWTVAVGP